MDDEDLQMPVAVRRQVVPWWLALLLVPIFCALWGWSIAVVWNTWMVPLGIERITSAHGFGLSLLFALVRMSTSGREPDDDLDVLLLKAATFPIAFLALNWLSYQLYLAGY